MATRNNIKDELKEISPWLAEISAATPYEVPQGYFDHLPSRIVSRIEQQKKPFEVPAGYFEKLPEIILNRIRAIESQAPMLELEGLSPLLSKLGKEVPFSIPQGYFEDLSQDLVDGLKAVEFVHQELEMASPLFNDVKNKNVYSVPQDYFETLPEKILNKVKRNSGNKVHSIPMSKKVYRFAIAAALTGVIALGAWLFLRNDNPVAQAGILAGIEKVSDEEIIHFLDNNEVFNPENFSVASSEIKQEDVKALLMDVSDEELQQYLEKYSVSRDLTNN